MRETSFGEPAEGLYKRLTAKRTGVVSIGRRLAALTIPSVFPPENYDTSHDSLEIANQSINAYLVNSLSNTLMLTALPPNLPMCKYSLNEVALQGDIEQDGELYSETNYALSRREEVHRTRIENTSARDVYSSWMRLSIVTGNGLCIWTDINAPVVYNLHNWVTVRDAKGTPLVTILEDTISLAAADEDVAEAVIQHRTDTNRSVDAEKTEWEDTATIYHCQKIVKNDKGENEFLYWQETEGGYAIPGTEFYSPFEVPPMYPYGMILETGSDYGLGYCSDYEGDLKAVEELSASFQDGAAALAWFLYFVDPTGQTNIRDVENADNLDVLPGRADDVSTLRSEKSSELSVVDSAIEKVARRLGMAFASEASIQRNGERVTAEEWKRMAMALDKAMGGLYSKMAQGPQRWFILRFIHLHHQEEKRLKRLPADLVKVNVVTGLEGIGQSSDYAALIDVAKDVSELLGPEGLRAEINGSDLIRRLLTYRSIKADGLVKSDDQKAQEASDNQSQQQQQAVLEKASAPVASGGMEMLMQMMQQQGNQDVPN